MGRPAPACPAGDAVAGGSCHPFPCCAACCSLVIKAVKFLHRDAFVTLVSAPWHGGPSAAAVKLQRCSLLLLIHAPGVCGTGNWGRFAGAAYPCPSVVFLSRGDPQLRHCQGGGTLFG